MRYKNQGNILVYAIILINIALVVAYIIFTKSTILLENADLQTINTKQNKNIQEKADLAIRYDLAVNSDGSGFTNSLSCPASVTLSGNTLSGTTVTQPYFNGSILTCSGSSGVLQLLYDPTYSTFSSGSYAGSTIALTGSPLTGTFADSDSTQISFVKPITYSNLDGNYNSDDYRVFSTGNVLYPNNFSDNDVTARRVLYGYVKKDGGYTSVFWNNFETNNYIVKNTNNNDPLNATISITNTGYLLFDIDSPYTMRIVEFDSGAFAQNREVRKIGSLIEYSSNSGTIGYIQNNGSLLNDTGATVKVFDFKNRNYGIFLSFTGSIYNPEQQYLKYKISGKNNFGSGLYIVPLDDTSSSIMRYMGNDIMIDSQNRYLGKQLEIIKAR